MKQYNIVKFLQLDFNDQSFIIENLMPDKYYGCQTNIFKQEENHTSTIEEEQFKQYVKNLAIEYFKEKKIVYFDMEKEIEISNIENEKFLSYGIKGLENQTIIFNDENKDLN